jgi:hypothetical protein
MYFVTNGASSTNGFLTMPVPTGATGRQFPVGPSAGNNDYNPLTMKHAAGSDVNFDVKVFTDVSDDDGTDVTDHSIDRTWLALQHSGGSLSNVTSTHQWTGAQENSSLDRANTYISWRSTDPIRDAAGTYAWKATQAAGASGGSDPYTHVSGSIGSSTMLNNTKYYLAIGDNSGTALPVTWLSFDANYSNKQANLAWKTATETNNSHFEVQRSADGKSWNTVGRIAGRGNSKIVSSYTFTDKSAGSLNLNTIYYRLTQVDFNGQFDYSAIKVVRPTAEPVIEAYPNPATDKINVNTEVAGNTSIQLLSANGMPVFTEQFYADGKVQKVINLGTYPKGMYFIRIVSEAGSTTRTIYKN